MSFLSSVLTKPAEVKVDDIHEIKKSYRYWRIRIFYSMYFGYAFFYFTRKSLTFAMPTMMKDLHLDKAQIGWFATAMYIVYGLSKFFNGIISDRANPQIFMSIGLIFTGIANICFGFSSLFVLLMLFWVINGFFQGTGWPPCGKLLTHWYSHKERGRWWGVWNTCHNLGGFLIPIIVGFAATYWGWRSAMYVPGIIAIVMGLLLLNRLRDIPETMGLPKIEDYRHDYPTGKNSSFMKKASVKEILFKYVICNKFIWLLCFAYTLVYIVRTGINDWGAIYLSEHGYSTLKADTCLSFFELGGFFGSIFSGFLSDWVFRGGRGQMNVLYSIGIILSVIALWKLPGNFFWPHAAAIFAIGFFVFGPQMLIGVAAAELSHREAAGTATGFLGLFGYLGAALSGAPVGVITDHWHWTGFFILMTVCSILSVALLVPLWSVRPGDNKRKVAVAEAS